MYQHCHFIAAPLVAAFLGEQSPVGRGDRSVRRRVDLAAVAQSRTGSAPRRAAELDKEGLEQNFADGVNREQAIWYHHAVADMMLSAGLIAGPTA